MVKTPRPSKTSCGARHNKPRPLLPPSEWYWLVNASPLELWPVITNKLTFDPPTRLPELTQNLIRSSHGHSVHLPWKFHANRSSRFLVMLLTKKQRKKERNRPKTIPRPPTGGGVTIFTDSNLLQYNNLRFTLVQQTFSSSSYFDLREYKLHARYSV